MLTISYYLLLCFSISVYVTSAITCYECSASQGQDCKYSAKPCAYGFFGCVKIAAYAGGVDRQGNWELDQERRIISITRGCSIIPFGTVDMCSQTTLFGTRIQKCVCFNDYCNASPSFSLSMVFFLLAMFVL